LSALRRTNPSTSTNSRMDTSCCSLSVKVVFQNSSRLGNKPRCKVPFNQDTAFPSFTAISSDKASFLPNAQYQSLACAASLLTIQTQQENTFARASSVCHLFSRFENRTHMEVCRMRTSLRGLLLLITLFSSLLPLTALSAERGHPEQVTVNGKTYAWPRSPVVVVCIDGGDPEYVGAALEKKLLPNMKRFMDEGFSAVAYGAMPSFTNPNNISIITGMPPSVHGISGNYFLNPETGKEVMMNEPEFLRADSILAEFSKHGAKVVAITAKDKLTKLLRHKIKDGITFSSEKADKCTIKENGIENCLEYVGKSLPDVYSGDLSLFVLEAGIKILEREKPDITYLSLTDYIQHKYAPGTREANEFYQALDNAFGRLAATGALVALTGDHGMNDKSNPDGSPKVVYLQDVLDKQF